MVVKVLGVLDEQVDWTWLRLRFWLVSVSCFESEVPWSSLLEYLESFWKTLDWLLTTGSMLHLLFYNSYYCFSEFLFVDNDIESTSCSCMCLFACVCLCLCLSVCMCLCLCVRFFCSSFFLCLFYVVSFFVLCSIQELHLGRPGCSAYVFWLLLEHLSSISHEKIDEFYWF